MPFPLGTARGILRASQAFTHTRGHCHYCRIHRRRRAGRNCTAAEIAAFKTAANAAPSAANGPVALAAPNWGKNWGALKKIGGFAKSVGGKYQNFANWVNSRPWYVKYLIKGLSPGLSIYDI
ncbi:hypothetical protein [Streptomyces kasugaensis]|uniref:hypothetical protein n=1 Tax=Streptomyces kasugaensis TaxID=1946 RepID=UPI0013EFA9DF|nr:hypothetical protein [Streptomyces kasugaensis]